MPFITIKSALVAAAFVVNSVVAVPNSIPRGVGQVSVRPRSALYERDGSGKITYYGVDGDPAPTQYYGSCGIEPAQAPANFVAVNAADMNKGMCGTCLEVTYNGNCAVVVVEDTCPGCPKGGLDLNINAFGTLVGGTDKARELGVVQGVAWKQVACNSACSGNGGGAQPAPKKEEPKKEKPQPKQEQPKQEQPKPTPTPKEEQPKQEQPKPTPTPEQQQPKQEQPAPSKGNGGRKHGGKHWGKKTTTVASAAAPTATPSDESSAIFSVPGVTKEWLARHTDPLWATKNLKKN